MKARTIKQVLDEVTQTQALEGVAGRLTDIEDSVTADGKFSQKAKLTDKDGNGPLSVKVCDPALVLDKRLDGVPVYFIATSGKDDAPLGVGVCVKGSQKFVLVKEGATLLVHVQNGNKPGTLSYEKWLQAANSKAPAASKPEPKPEAKAEVKARPKPAVKAEATTAVNARIEDEKHRRDRARDLQQAFLTARANAQAVLVCHLEALRWAHMVKDQFGEVMDNTNIAAMRTNFIMRNCTNGTNIVGLMPARRKDRGPEDIGFEAVIREHEEMHGYKLSSSEFVTAAADVAEEPWDYVSTIKSLFGDHLPKVQEYMEQTLQVRFEKGQSWKDADDTILETVIINAEELLGEFSKAA